MALRMRFHAATARLAVALTVAIAAGLFGGVVPVYAFKPNTHNYTGFRVWDEVTQTGAVTITNASGLSHPYTVDARLVSALKAWPAFYNAGVIGPDGFPDIIYGQQIVHPDHTGQWLRYMYRQAWAAQSDPQYSADQRAQILAFVYGYLTHAAGDMWGHTFVNDFAGGVFPSVTKTFSDLGSGDTRRLLIALRHIVSEGYVGDATPGFDVFNGDDLPDPLKGCNPAQLVNSGQGGIDTQCNNDPTQIQEASVVCDPNSPPTRPGTTCMVPGQFNNPVPDVSLDSTPGIQLDAPNQWIQNVMISQDAPTPNNQCIAAPTGDGCPGGAYSLGKGVDRGYAIDFFLDMEARLKVASARFRDDANFHDCISGGPCTAVQVTLPPINTVRGIKRDEVVTHLECTGSGICVPNPLDTGIIDGFSADYLDAWIADIDVGLAHWSEFSLAIAKGFFDPQARRDAANDTCQGTGPETVDIGGLSRDICEKKVSHLDAAIWEADHIYPTGAPSFINRYLIPMLGAPDFLGDIRHLSQQLADAVGAVFNFLGIQNPLTAIINFLHELEVSLIEDQIKQSWGVDIKAWETFGEHVSHWFCGLSGVFQPFTFTVPYGGPTITISATDLFTPDQHALMDMWLGLPADHHHSGSKGDDTLTINGVPVPKDCTPLSDSAKFDANNYAAVKDTVVMAKLLLLDGPGLDRVLGDALVDQGVINNANSVKTYEPATAPSDGLPANIMFASLANGSAGDDIEPFLQLIDGDHAWRQDGLPTFCQKLATYIGPGNCATLPAELGVYTRQPAPRQFDAMDETGAIGGNGTFPLWASCLLRPAFRGLFTDWENLDNKKNGGTASFPDLGDLAGPDASAPNSGSATASATSNFFVDARGTFVGPTNQFTVAESDAVFRLSQVDAQYRFYLQTAAPSTFQPGSAPFLANGGTFSIPAGSGDGLYNVDTRAQDPCHLFASLLASANATTSVYLDTTAPVITITQPAAADYTHSQTLTLNYTVDDGAGSGVKSFTATLDGSPTLNGHGLQSGQVINLLTELSLGPHTFTIDAVDNVGNRSSRSVTFNIIVTPQSIVDDIDQFVASGDITKHGIAQSLLAKLDAAADARSRGNCKAAGNIYTAFIHEVSAQTGKAITAEAAAIMIADAQYLIAHCP